MASQYESEWNKIERQHILDRHDLMKVSRISPLTSALLCLRCKKGSVRNRTVESCHRGLLEKNLPTLSDRINILQIFEKLKNKGKIECDYNISSQTVRLNVDIREEWEHQLRHGVSLDSRAVFKPKYSRIDEALLSFVWKVWKIRIPVTHSMLQERARIIARDLKIRGFLAPTE